MMTYKQAREYTEKISKIGSIPGLFSIQRLMEKLSNVQEKLSVIHIAGTNGKGSVGTFLAYGLMEAGYRVGRYTSPAVFSPLEVWQINGENITTEDYTGTLSQVKEACDILVSEGMPQPTVFEVETAVAFLYFYRKNCDFVVAETGMGGTLDATNLITHPVCSVITSISMDHMQFLGNEISEIAQAKAGIIKPHCPVVTIRQSQEVMEVLKGRAKECKTFLWTAEPDMAEEIKNNPCEISYIYRSFRQEDQPESKEKISKEEETEGNGNTGKETEERNEKIRITLQMAGMYQIENSLLAAVTLQKIFHLPLETIAAGFHEARWPGRFEVIKKEPLFVIDGAHNEDAAEKLCQTIENYFTNRSITYIIGVLADKEYDKMLQKLLPFARRVYTVTPQNPRALSAERLAAAARAFVEKSGENGENNGKMPGEIRACSSVEEAVKQALENAESTDVILAFGSLSYLGEVKASVSCPDKGER